MPPSISKIGPVDLDEVAKNSTLLKQIEDLKKEYALME